MDIVLDVAFVVAVVAFIKANVANLEGWQTVLVALVVSMFAAFTPLLLEQFPVIAPWMEAFIKGIGLLLGAAGSVDFVKKNLLNQ